MILLVKSMQDFVASQKAQLTALTSARSILLTSFKTSQSNLSTIRMELNAAAKELARERDSASTTKRDLVRAKASLKLAETEIVETKATCAELEESVKQLSSDATGDIKKDEAVERQLNELKKTIEKEKSKREKIESDAKDLKVSRSYP
jgi:chromosome segregation ATPase